MEKITGNEPAMPLTLTQDTNEFQPGLTIRQQFAAMAMQGLIAANYSDSEGNAREAVRHADALIAELNKAA